MQIKVNQQSKGKELRKVVVQSLSELMAENEKIVALEADLGGASGWSTLKKNFPERFVNVGIAEANMMGVAAGLSQTGMIPFVHTFGPFATRRAFDQLYLSGGYAKNTINIYGSDPGFAAGMNGGTHTTWEDVALMRMIPGSVVCDAADEVQLAWIIKAFSRLTGVHYVRANRKDVYSIYEPNTTFELGKGNILRQGKEILIVSAGQLVHEALEVANELEKRGHSVTVVDMFTIKPFDEALFLKLAHEKKRIITIENHSIEGGLGSIVAETMASKQISAPLQRIGVYEQFGQVGTPQFYSKHSNLQQKQY